MRTLRTQELHLGTLTKLGQPVPADHDAPDGQESLMDVITLLVTNPKSSLLEEPSEDSLDDAAVFSQTASMGCVPSCDPGNDPLGPEGPANLFLGIIGSVRIQLHWPFAPSTARAFDGRNRIH